MSASILERLIVGRDLPDGYDAWALKATDFAGRTRNGYQWPAYGETERLTMLDHNGSCPNVPGDGVCIATTYAGLSSGGHRAMALLLVAYRSAESRSDENGKLRIPQAYVVERLDGEQVVKKYGANADLTDANLTGANLSRADLTGANLTGANLSRANLTGANLAGANLSGAYLTVAYLPRADLTDANLAGANLSRADLTGADLTGANLTGANLSGAYLTGAYLPRADLTGANLAGAYLSRADLTDAIGYEP